MTELELGVIGEKLEELGAAFAEELGKAYRAGRESMKAEALRALDDASRPDSDYFPWRFTLEQIEP